MVAKGFAFVYVAQMDFDSRHGYEAQGVIQRVAVMRKRACIYDYSIVYDEFVKLVDQVAFVVGLIEIETESEKILLQLDQYLFEAFVAIDFDFALTGEVQVGAVKDEDVHSEL